MGVAAGLMAAGAGMSGIGNIYGAVAQYQASKAQAKVLKAEAANDETRADFARLQGSLAADVSQKNEIRALAEGKSGYAGGNVLLDSKGTVGNWAAGTAEEFELDRQIILDNAEMNAWGFRQDAWAKKTQATLVRRAGKVALVSGLLSAAGGMAGGAGSMLGNAGMTA